MLHSLGFAVKRISGRVFVPGKGFKDEFDHLAVVASIRQQGWLADVGLGRMFPMIPLQIVLDLEQEDQTGVYRIVRFDS